MSANQNPKDQPNPNGPVVPLADLFTMLDARLAELRELSVKDQRQALTELAAELGIEIKFCRASNCGRPFVPRKTHHEYHDKRCRDWDWNNIRVAEEKTK